MSSTSPPPPSFSHSFRQRSSPQTTTNLLHDNETKSHVLSFPYWKQHNSKNIHKILLLSTLLFFLFTVFICYHLFHYSSAAVPLYPFVSLPRSCDTSKGNWVADPNAPYYTNTTCFTIQEHQNCMKFGRPDRAFLKWRWKPDDCELTPFDPVRFFQLAKGKKLAFIGDSLARNQMQSLLCLLSRVAHPKDISYSGDEHFKRYYYPHYSFTIASFWSNFLIRAKETTTDGPNHTGLWDLFLDEVDRKWASQIELFDYVVISSGNWFTRPSMFYEKGKLIGCHYCKQDNITNLSLFYSHRVAFQTALQTITNLKNFKGQVFVRTVSPSHFEQGEWNTGGICLRTRPYRRNQTTLDWLDGEFYRTQIEEFKKAETQAKQNGINLRLLDTTAAMLLRPDGHPNKYGHWPNDKVAMYNDCVHWCLPGPIDLWNNLMFHMIHESQESESETTTTTTTNYQEA